MRLSRVFAALCVLSISVVFMLFYCYHVLLENIFQMRLWDAAPIFSAIGTLSIAIVNLFLILSYGWPDHPKFVLELLEPDIRTEELSPHLTTASGPRSRIRVKVTNRGEVTANNCAADIEFKRDGWRPREPDIALELVPRSLLHWNRNYFSETVITGPHMVEYHDLASRAALPLDIRPGQSELLDVAFAPAYDRDVENLYQRRRAQLYTARWMHERERCDQLDSGSYEAVVTVFSSNAKPMKKKLKLTYDGGHDLRPEVVD